MDFATLSRLAISPSPDAVRAGVERVAAEGTALEEVAHTVRRHLRLRGERGIAVVLGAAGGAVAVGKGA